MVYEGILIRGAGHSFKAMWGGVPKNCTPLLSLAQQDTNGSVAAIMGVEHASGLKVGTIQTEGQSKSIYAVTRHECGAERGANIKL